MPARGETRYAARRTARKPGPERERRETSVRASHVIGPAGSRRIHEGTGSVFAPGVEVGIDGTGNPVRAGLMPAQHASSGVCASRRQGVTVDMSAMVGAMDQIAALCTSLRELFGRILRAGDFNGPRDTVCAARCCCGNRWVNPVTAKWSFAAARRDTKRDSPGPERQRTGAIYRDGRRV
jgi:hypothetical protein